MKGVVQSFTRAKLRRLAKYYWASNVEEFSVVKRTASSKDALAYAYFSYAGGHKKSAKQVSELTKTARRCGQTLRGDGRGSSSDSSRTSNSSLPEKKRFKKFSEKTHQ